jgi:pyruvate/2-oxoglutarate dehydrogenase complex dihydrolipoamide dehydrogenase (E3) component
MARYTHDVIIVGGGAGGLTAAVGCAQLGMKTALIDKERFGGDCLHYSCVPSKTLLKSATVYHQAREAERFGLPAMELPAVDMTRINSRIAAVIAEIAVHDSPERFQKLGAEVFLGNVEFVSPHELSFNGDQTLSAPRIILATGSSPRSLPIPGLEETGYITNLDAFSLAALPSRIVTIGAGPIGLELSQAFSRLGAGVTILDVAPQVLPREDEDMADVIRQRMVKDGIAFRLGVSIARIEKQGSTKRVVLKTDSGEDSPGRRAEGQHRQARTGKGRGCGGEELRADQFENGDQPETYPGSW